MKDAPERSLAAADRVHNARPPTPEAGLYLHIPFCKQACHYCNFHFSTSLQLKALMVDAMCRELELRAATFAKKRLATVYLGGGTPSLLTAVELDRLFQTIEHHFQLHKDAEITLEANPDDIHADRLKAWRKAGINRLSIGVQSFFDDTLKWLNRVHDARQAHQSIDLASKHGFSALSVDLIYGIPGQDMPRWKRELNTVLHYDLPHISAYGLTVEPGTALEHFIRKGKMPAPDDSVAARHFDDLIRTLEDAGYHHYEISSFAKPGRYAVHNTGYWTGMPYLGIGPGAHSYLPGSKPVRAWNVAHNKKYVDALQRHNLPLTREKLARTEQYNELVLTGLRTMWGIELQAVRGRFGQGRLNNLREQAASFVKEGLLEENDSCLRLTRAGKPWADRVTAALFQGS